MKSLTDSGIVTLNSKHSVERTVQALQQLLQTKGIKLFALIDHSGEAAAVGLRMPETKLLIFGSPNAGTPLMLASPTIAIDLPLKILVWQDSAGQVKISYNSPESLQARHGFPQELVQNIAAVKLLAEALAAMP